MVDAKDLKKELIEHFRRYLIVAEEGVRYMEQLPESDPRLQQIVQDAGGCDAAAQYLEGYCEYADETGIQDTDPEEFLNNLAEYADYSGQDSLEKRVMKELKRQERARDAEKIDRARSDTVD